VFRSNVVKARLRAGEPVLGLSHALANSTVAELIGVAGFDFVLIDSEHGIGHDQDHLHCLQAIAGTGARAFLRVSGNDPVVLKRALDLGVEGIMVPNVSNAAEARAVVSGCRYPPKGIRGFAATGVRASDYGLQGKRYLREYEDELLIAVMIESRVGVENAGAIAAVDGVDVIQIGVNDLGYDLGVPDDPDHPRLRDAVAAIERAALDAGKWLGGAPYAGTGVATLIERGYRLLTLGRDVGLLGAALSALLERAKVDAERAV
jgi:4-hydroxy-2-oxoheptanedioate aldolase